jgi:hypothetical protein
MFESWYLPIPMFPLWPCVVAILVFIPVSIWHERNWRRTLAEYAERRHAEGAPPGVWPTADLAIALSLQPWLVLGVTTALALVTGFGIYAAVLWPYRPPGFDLPINPYDLPFLWSMIVAGAAAVAAGLAIGIDGVTSPWAPVAHELRRSMYAKPEVRERRFSAAISADPGVPHEQGAAAVEDESPPSDGEASTGPDGP